MQSVFKVFGMNEQEIIEWKKEVRRKWLRNHSFPKFIRKYLDDPHHHIRGFFDLLHDILEDYYEDTADKYYKKSPIVAGGIPIDWVHTDPVFNHILNNKVPENSKRNAVLFKNIAIGMVYSGFSKSQIIGYSERIIKNCHGKNINEILGWVKKIQSDMDKGKDWIYNEKEMNKWLSMFKGVKNG